MSIRVLICDDHPVYRKGLRALLAEFDEVEVTGEAADGEEALDLAAAEPPDVVVMDLHLPGISGVETTARLVAAHPGIGVLVLTMFEDDTSLTAALRAGAKGYLVKGADHEEIRRALHSVGRGEILIGRGVSDRLAAAVANPGPSRPLPELTSREFDIVELISVGLSTQEIAARLFLSPKTVSNNLSAIFAKLGVESRAALVARARDAGLGADSSS